VIVVDASLVTQWIFREDLHELAGEFLAEHTGHGELIAPHLFLFECTNIVRKRMRRSRLSYADSVVALDRFLTLGVRILPDADGDRAALHYRALELANEYDLPATYDAHYMALAEALRCDFWTADQRLLRQLNGRASYVRALGEFQPQ
jgi:predicted nucleic acid-binding protein